MIDCGNTKIRYEDGEDAPEFAPFYDFEEANKEFLESDVLKRRGVVEDDYDDDVEAGTVDEEVDGDDDVSDGDDEDELEDFTYNEEGDI